MYKKAFTRLPDYFKNACTVAPNVKPDFYHAVCANIVRLFTAQKTMIENVLRMKFQRFCRIYSQSDLVQDSLIRSDL